MLSLYICTSIEHICSVALCLHVVYPGWDDCAAVRRLSSTPQYPLKRQEWHQSGIVTRGVRAYESTAAKPSQSASQRRRGVHPATGGQQAGVRSAHRRCMQRRLSIRDRPSGLPLTVRIHMLLGTVASLISGVFGIEFRVDMTTRGEDDARPIQQIVERGIRPILAGLMRACWSGADGAKKHVQPLFGHMVEHPLSSGIPIRNELMAQLAESIAEWNQLASVIWSLVRAPEP